MKRKAAVVLRFLKPCPECGRAAVVVEFMDRDDGLWKYRVECRRGPACYHGPASMYQDRAESAWNAHRRVSKECRDSG